MSLMSLGLKIKPHQAQMFHMILVQLMKRSDSTIQIAQYLPALPC